MAKAINYYAPSCSQRDDTEIERLQELRIDVSDTANLMGDNIHKGLLRGFKLEELENRSEHLEVEARQFHKTSKKVLNKYWWKSKKRSLIIAGLALVAILIIVFVILLSIHPWRSGNQNPHTSTQSTLASQALLTTKRSNIESQLAENAIDKQKDTSGERNFGQNNR